MRWVLALWVVWGTVLGQSPTPPSALFFTKAVHGVSTDSLHSWQVVAVQKIKVTFYIGGDSVTVKYPLRVDRSQIMTKYRRNGALIYLLQQAKGKAVLIHEGNDLRYIIEIQSKDPCGESSRRWFQTRYTNEKKFT